MFRIARAGCQAFLRDTVGRYHDLWREAAAVPLKRITRRKGNPQTPEQADEIREKLGDVYGPIWWSMCVTGMGPGELWGEWEVKKDRILIHGTKRDARDRVIPLVETPIKPTTLQPAFARALKKCTAGAVQPYDGRRSFATWMEAAGIDRTRRRLYLGHKEKDVTDLYEDHDVGPHTQKDARALKSYLRRKLTKLRLAK